MTRLGDPIHLNCTAKGHPAPTYEWYKDGVLIPDEIESVLYIPEPSPEDRGNYTCKAINSEGETDQSDPAKLDIAGMTRKGCNKIIIVYLKLIMTYRCSSISGEIKHF